MNYREAKDTFDIARSPRKGKPLQNNTRLFARIDTVSGGGDIKPGISYAVRLHETDVVTIHPGGTYTLNSGGWRTPTTKNRINDYAPVTVFSMQGVWYVRGAGETSLFHDRMIVGSDGRILTKKDPEPYKASKAEVDKMVKTYIDGFARFALGGELRAPGPGDYWGCAFKRADIDHPRGIEGEPMGVGHLFDHFREGYFVPSLLMKAIIQKGYRNPGLIWGMIEAEARRGDTRTLRQILSWYFRQ
ncbi:MAG: hypothetical protein R3253_02655, partial [Longimicrobiales bacterium]|nr:hypothetical protein [Longimicrobiales bacterium]